MVLRLNENGSKQNESSRFPFMEVVRNIAFIINSTT